MAADPAETPAPRETAPDGGIRLGTIVLLLLALLPVWRVFDLTADARRNVVYWDEFDTALALALKLDSRPPVAEIARELLSVTNQQRSSGRSAAVPDCSARVAIMPGVLPFLIFFQIGQKSIFPKQVH